ncbi:hypothetical protein HK405_002454, partial [Cladochytrium tenue]
DELFTKALEPSPRVTLASGPPTVNENADDDAESHVFFTSGSTGRPKGCSATRGNLTAFCAARNEAHVVGSGAVVFVASPHTFDPALGDALAALAAGATVASARRSATFAALGKCLSSTLATHVCATPAAFGTLGDGGWGPDELPALRVVALGGEPMPAAVAARWAGRVRLLNTYGVTECCVYQTVAEVAVDAHPLARRALGEALGATRVLLMAPASDAVDWAAMEPVPEDAVTRLEGSVTDTTAAAAAEAAAASLADGLDARSVGEVWIAGPQVGTGYVGRDELTRARFI